MISNIIDVIRKNAYYFIAFFCTGFFIYIFKSMVFDLYIVKGESMASTLHNGEFIFVSKYSYNICTPKYLPFLNIKIPYLTFDGLEMPRKGDIVLFKLPMFRNGENLPLDWTLVKRIVALPGDTVKFEYNDFNSKLFTHMKQILGKWKMFSLRVPQKNDTIYSSNINNQFIGDLIQNEGHNLALEENGTVIIDGKSVSSYIIRNNYYFLRGDNENFSSDSRDWGFVPKENLIGKVLF